MNVVADELPSACLLKRRASVALGKEAARTSCRLPTTIWYEQHIWFSHPAILFRKEYGQTG